MYRGRFTQGQEVPLSVITTNGSGVPTPPDAAPTVAIYGPSGLVLAAKAIPVLDRYGTPVQATLFGWRLFLGPAYPPGAYSALYSFTTGLGAHIGGGLDYFEVAAGGDSKGAITSVYYDERPQGGYVVQGLDSGRLVKNRGPRL